MGNELMQEESGHVPPPPADGCLSFQQERRFWREVLNGTVLREVAPVLWQFLDDHPHSLRFASSVGGQVLEMSFRRRAADDSAFPQITELKQDIVGDAFCFFQNGSWLAYGLGHCLAVVCVDRNLQLRLSVEGLGGRQVSDGSLTRTASPEEEDENDDLGILFEGHTGEVTCAAAAPTKNFLVTGSADESVRLWRWSPAGTDDANSRAGAGSSTSPRRNRNSNSGSPRQDINPETGHPVPVCIKHCTSMEWAEWAAVVHLGHTCSVSAVEINVLNCKTV
jgi:WD40 repeat protein